MKLKFYTTGIMLAFSLTGLAQSKSFERLHDRFNGRKDVVNFSLGGFFAQLAVSLASEGINADELGHIGQFYVLVIPKSHFDADGVTLTGYARFAQKKDSFEELLSIKDKKDNVRIFMKTGKHSNLYLLLVDGGDEVVAVEFTGNINPDKLFCSKV